MAKNNKNNRSRVTQQQIAENLNLSVATVSKALRGYTDINSETHTKVVEMASRLGYDFGSRAGQKVEPEADIHRVVGIFVESDPDNWEHPRYFAGMSNAYAQMNVSLVFHYFSRADCRCVLLPEKQPPAMREGLLNGIVLVNEWPAEVVRQLAARMPCVSILNEYPGVQLDVVGIDEQDGIGMLTDHLYQLGHRKIGFFTKNGAAGWAQARFGAYVASLYRLGIEFEPGIIIGMSADILDDKETTLKLQVKQVSEQIRRGVGAWVCASSRVGYALCRALLDRGFRVPQEVSIVGFGDGETEEERLGCPELTSASVAPLTVGAEALKRLLARLHHPGAPRDELKLKCRFVAGKTTGSVAHRKRQNR